MEETFTELETALPGCEIKRDGEQFTVALSDDKTYLIVTDEKGVAVTIHYRKALVGDTLIVKLPDGSGYQVGSDVNSAVDNATSWLRKLRQDRLTAEQAYQEMFDYVEDCRANGS